MVVNTAQRTAGGLPTITDIYTVKFRRRASSSLLANVMFLTPPQVGIWGESGAEPPEQFVSLMKFGKALHHRCPISRL